MKQKYKLAAFSLILSVFLAGCSSSTSGSEGKDAIMIGIDTAAGGSLQIRAANAEGFFTDLDIDPKISNFAYGIDTINALLTEQTDTGLAADYVLLNSLNRGDLVVISSLSHSTEATIKESEFVAVKGIDTPADLKGKRIGVAKGTVSEYHWANYLATIGVSEKDIEYVPFSTPDEAIVGVKKGDIDAVLSSGAVLEKLKAIDGVHTIDNLSSANISTSSYLVANKKFVENNEEAVVNLLKAIKEGIAYVKENPDGTAEIAYKELKVKKEDTLRDLENINYTIGFTEEDIKHLSDMKQWLLDRGLLKKDYNIEDKLALDALQKALPEEVTYKSK